MSKDRVEPCKYYIHFGNCEKGREADFYNYCQKCNKYVPRIKVKHINQKKKKIQKIKEKEFFEEY